MDIRAKGGMSLRDRITSDPEYIKMKQKIQARYSLPLNYNIQLNYGEWRKWMGYSKKPSLQAVKRRKAFLKDIKVLFKKFEVPDAWQDDLLAEIAGQSYDPSLEPWSIPAFETYLDADENIIWHGIITPETDLTNPIIIQMIQSQQKRYAGTPSQPVRDPANPRKLDWRPVYEWYKRHPLFTVDEIAEKIGYPARTVKLKIAEIEAGK